MLFFKKIILSLFFCLSSVWASDIPEKDEKRIEMVLGIDKVEKLDFAPDTRVQIGNEGILNYQLIPQKREITFKGLKIGETSVIIRDTVGDIQARFIVNITQTDQSRIVKILKDFLGDIEGIEIGIKGESVYVGGKIIVPGDIGRIVLILDKYPDVLRLVELSPHTQLAIAKKMQEEIQNHSGGMKSVTVRVVNGIFWIEGVVSSDNEKVKAEKIAQIYIPDQIENLSRRLDSVKKVERSIIQNFIQVNVKKKPPSVPKILKIKAQFVELSKDYNKVFGFKWNPILAGSGGTIDFGRTTSGGVTTKASGTLSGTISNLFPKLASARGAGYARVIQSGVIIVNENETGSLNKVSEKTFSLGTGDFTKGEKVTSGFQMTVSKPQVLPKENIKMKVDLSVSSTIGTPPEKLDNKVSTTLLVKSRDSAVIGGVVVDKSATAFDRDPPDSLEVAEGGTSVFSFLRSKSYSRNKGQFVIFITPEIIESASDGTEEIKRKFRRRRQ